MVRESLGTPASNDGAVSRSKKHVATTQTTSRGLGQDVIPARLASQTKHRKHFRKKAWNAELSINNGVVPDSYVTITSRLWRKFCNDFETRGQLAVTAVSTFRTKRVYFHARNDVKERVQMIRLSGEVHGKRWGLLTIRPLGCNGRQKQQRSCFISRRYTRANKNAPRTRDAALNEKGNASDTSSQTKNAPPLVSSAVQLTFGELGRVAENLDSVERVQLQGGALVQHLLQDRLDRDQQSLLFGLSLFASGLCDVNFRRKCRRFGGVRETTASEEKD